MGNTPTQQQQPSSLIAGASTAQLCEPPPPLPRLVRADNNSVLSAFDEVARDPRYRFAQLPALGPLQMVRMYVSPFVARSGVVNPDARTARMVHAFGTRGRDDTAAHFLAPYGVTVLPFNKHIVVSDGGRNEVLVFDSDGRLIRSFGGSGAGKGQLCSPCAVASDLNSVIAVADTSNNRVNLYDERGSVVRTITGDFRTPYGVAFNSRGELAVAAGAQLTLHSSDGRVVGRKSAPAEVRGVSFDPSDNVAVALMHRHHVVLFAHEGSERTIKAWGGRGGVAAEFLLEPIGVAFDADSCIVVSDTARARVHVYRADGAWQRTFGTRGAEDSLRAGEFCTPADVCVADGDVLVVDFTGCRITRWR